MANWPAGFVWSSSENLVYQFECKFYRCLLSWSSLVCPSLEKKTIGPLPGFRWGGNISHIELLNGVMGLLCHYQFHCSHHGFPVALRWNLGVTCMELEWFLDGTVMELKSNLDRTWMEL